MDRMEKKTEREVSSLVSFLIRVKPKPQQRHRSNGRFQYDPSSKDKKEFSLLAKQYAPATPTSKAIELDLTFCYKRPRNHYRSKNKQLILKSDMPFYKKSRADIDNLIKFVADSLNEIFYVDDAQIVSVRAIKIWGEEDSVLVKISTTKKYLEIQE